MRRTTDSSCESVLDYLDDGQTDGFNIASTALSPLCCLLCYSLKAVKVVLFIPYSVYMPQFALLYSRTYFISMYNGI